MESLPLGYQEYSSAIITKRSLYKTIIISIIVLIIIAAIISLIASLYIIKPLQADCYCTDPLFFQTCTSGTEQGSTKCKLESEALSKILYLRDKISNKAKKILGKLPRLLPEVPRIRLPKIQRLEIPRVTIDSNIINNIAYSCPISI